MNMAKKDIKIEEVDMLDYANQIANKIFGFQTDLEKSKTIKRDNEIYNLYIREIDDIISTLRKKQDQLRIKKTKAIQILNQK